MSKAILPSFFFLSRPISILRVAFLVAFVFFIFQKSGNAAAAADKGGPSQTNSPAITNAPGTNALPSNLGDLSLEALMTINVPIVTGASKVAQKSTEAPASVTIITADEIKKYDHETLADVLRTVQGFNVSYDRNYAFLDARGLSLGDFNSRILLLVDGHRVNNNLTDGAFIDTGFILDMDLVDHIEIVRGPSSVLYGNNAFFGIINVITRQGGQINGLETSVLYGSFDQYKVRATYGKKFTNGLDGLEILASGTYFDDPGPGALFYPEFNTPAQNNGVAQNLDVDRDKSFFGSINYYDFNIESGYIAREKGNPTAQFTLTTFDDPRLRTSDDREYIALKFAHDFENVVDVTARLYYDKYTHEIGFPQSLLAGTNVLFSSFSQENDIGEWWGSELELTKKLWDKHTLTVGGEYRDDFHQEQDVSGQTPVNATRQSYGFYGQGDFALLDPLHLETGVRYDAVSGFSGAVTPRVAVIYHPVESSTLKAIYGTAFRTPNFSELSDPRFQNLQPEKIYSYELDYEQEYGPHFRSSVSAFYNDMDHLIVFNSGNFTNLNADTLGAEIAFEGSFDGITGRASYSYEHTRDKTLGWPMPDSPNNMLKLNVSVPVWSDKLFASAEFQYVSDRQSLHNTTDSFGEPLTVQGQTAGGYSVVNLTIFSQKIVKNLEISAGVYNLFNAEYFDPASRFHVQDLIQQDGRTFRAKVTYKF